MSLTEKKRKQLHSAILCYLNERGFSKSAEAFKEEAKAEEKASAKKMLEMKWNAVLRLQNKVMQLEDQIGQLKEDLNNSTPFQKREKDQSTLLPNKVLHEMKGHRQPVTSVGFHPKFTWVASGSDDNSVRLWDWESGDFVKTLKGHVNAVQDVHFSPDGEKLATCSADMSIKIWDMEDENFKCVRTLQGHDHNVSGVRFTPDGGQLVSCSRDETIKVWNADNGYCVRTMMGHEGWVRVIEVSDDGSWVASGSQDQTVRIWDLSSGKVLQIYKDHSHIIECLAFSNYKTDNFLTGEDSKMDEDDLGPPRFLASGSRDRSIKIFDLTAVQCVIRLNGHDNWVRGLIFHPEGKFLLSCADDKTVRVWDLAKRKEKKRLDNAHDMFVQSISWNPISPIIATGGADNIIKVWDCN